MPVPVAHGNLVFLWNDAGVVTCSDAPSGKLHWRERVGGKFFASPIRIEDRIYCPSRKGRWSSSRRPTSTNCLAKIELEDRTHATPAVADGVMYLRTVSRLMSLGGKRSRISSQ